MVGIYLLPMDTKRQLFIKAEDTTDPNYGYEPNKRSVEGLFERGIININKPPNPTSHEVVAWIKQILGVRKAGHTGTLDLNLLIQ